MVFAKVKFNRLLVYSYIAIVLAGISACSGGGSSTEEFLELSGERYPVVLDQAQTEIIVNQKMPRMARWYQVYWGGLTVGDVFVEILPTKDGYGMKILIRSKGLAKMVTNWKSDSAATMIQVTPEDLRSKRFLTQFQRRDKKRRIDIQRDIDGKVISESNEPPENRSKRPAVPEKLKQGATDPITMILAARAKMQQAVREKKNQVMMGMYDGRRRTDIVFHVQGLDKNGRIYVTLEEKPIAGYTQNELEDMVEHKSVVHVLVDPKDLLPVEAKGESVFGTARVKLKQKCKTIDECMAAAE